MGTAALITLWKERMTMERRAILDTVKQKIDADYRSRLGQWEEEFYQVFNPGIGFCLAAESFSEDIKQICGEFSPRIIGRVL